MKKTKIHNMILYIIIIIILIAFIILSNKDFILNNNRITLKNMSQSTQEINLNKTIEELNKSHTDYSNYIKLSKTEIANALTREGVSTSSDDTLETITNNIGKIVQARTSNATATADNITEGKTAWVNGELIIGNGSDNNMYYENGKQLNISKAYVGEWRDTNSSRNNVITIDLNNYIDWADEANYAMCTIVAGSDGSTSADGDISHNMTGNTAYVYTMSWSVSNGILSINTVSGRYSKGKFVVCVVN